MKNINKEYHDLLNNILEDGVMKGDRTGTGTKSVFGRMIKYDMRRGFPLITTKRTWFKGVAHELLWFLNGETNIKYLVDNDVNIWNEWPHQDYVKAQKAVEEPYMDIKEYKEKIKSDSEFAKKWGGTGPIYGNQWVDFNGEGFNQIGDAIKALKNNPDSRRILVTALNPAKLHEMTLDPCHYTFQFETHEIPFFERVEMFLHEHPELEELSHEELEAMMFTSNFKSRYISLLWDQRSVDTFLGLPFNIASYALLLEMFAQQTNMVPFELTGMLGDTHIYTNHQDAVKELLARDIYKYPIPTLKLNKAKDIFSYKFEDFTIESYKCYPAIKAEIAI